MANKKPLVIGTGKTQEFDGSVDTLALGGPISCTNVSPSGTVDGRDIATDGTKLDTIETSADVTDATNVDAAGAVMNSDTTTASMSFVVDEDTMVSDSATKVPTQQSVKAYVDSQAGGGGDIAFVSQQTASNSAAIEFTGLTAESKYMLTVERALPASDDAALRMNYSDDNGSTWSSANVQYGGACFQAGVSGTTYKSNTSSSTHPFMSQGTGEGIGNATGEFGASGTVMLYNLNVASYPASAISQFTHMDTLGDLWTSLISSVTGDDANGGNIVQIDAIQLEMDTGNITSGVFTLYKIVDA